MTNHSKAWRSNPTRARPVVAAPTTKGTAARRPAKGPPPEPDKRSTTAPAPTMNPTPNQPDHDLVQKRHHDRDTRGVHVRRVPTPIWRRARENALRSGIPFREFVIAVLARCEPLEPHR